MEKMDNSCRGRSECTLLSRTTSYLNNLNTRSLWVCLSVRIVFLTNCLLVLHINLLLVSILTAEFLFSINSQDKVYVNTAI